MPPVVPSSAASDPDRLWDDYFSNQRPTPKDVRAAILRLHAAGKHAHVAAAIRAALRHGQPQPWMYEVLALNLEIQGAPQAEIERALLSSIDFAATDAEGLMLSAAYLTRFKADGPALRLYRQASELAPERAEPYLLGLKLAERTGDDDALAWAARGVLTAAWGKDHARQHQAAEDAVANRAAALKKAGDAERADRLLAAVAAAKQVDLDVRLTWSGGGDLDLSVHEPSGTVCGLDSPRTSGGGVLTHDGHGPKQENCYDEYVCAAGFPGVYRIEVRHAWGEIVGGRAKLVVTRHRGTPRETSRETTVALTEEGATVRLTLLDGRRQELLAVPDEPTTPAVRPGGSVVALLSADDPATRAAAERFRTALFQQGGATGGSIASGRQTPFVTGNVGYTPIVSVLSEGVTLNAQAVVSGDRRYVRLTLAPNFSTLTDVATFTFLSR